MKTYESPTVVDLGAAEALVLGETSPVPDNAVGFGQDIFERESIDE